MFDVSNTNFKGEELCKDCRFGAHINYNHYICAYYGLVENVGVCKLHKTEEHDNDSTG